MRHHHRSARTLVLALATLLSAGACASGGVQTSARQQVQLVASLRPFSACDDLLAHLRAEALDRVGPYGLDGGPIVMEDFTEGGMPATSAPAGDAATTSGAAPAEPRQSDPDVSSTNVQEAGVDEPDVVKADGERILAVAGGALHWIDVSSDTPTEVGTVDLPDGYGHQILVAGDRALVLVTGSGGPVPIDDVASTDAFVPPPGAMTTTIAQVDVSSPAAMAVTDTLEVEGSILDARLVGDTARVVVTSPPENLDFVYPSTSSPGAEQTAEETNRRIIEESEVEDWLPAYRATTGAADGTVEGPLVECDRMERPSAFSGFGTLSVLTFDVPGDLGTGDAVGILANGENVYASAEHLYVATTDFPEAPETDPTNDFPPPPPAPTTSVHRFAIDGNDPAEYELSGAVRGRLLDQFSLSESGDQLRVATTDDETQESYVTVLEPDGDQLTETGQVGGLGEGEQIYSVRFVGDVGYVVTFEQTDPLYTVDLSDPAAPAVAGELELLGYSAYLHPLGGGLLLGIGQDATAGGQTTGTQLSLFDVSDPASPTRLQQTTLPGAGSAAEYDHHAFLYWPETGLAVLPIQSYGGDVIVPEEPLPTVPAPPTEAFNGAVGFHVDPDGIDEVGRITHDDGSTLTRSVVVGDTLYTLSDTSLVASDLTTLAPEASLTLA